MGKSIKLKRGANLNLEGVALKERQSAQYNTVVLKPTDFTNLIPKLLVKVGDNVKAGTPIFFNKKNERVKFCSPVSGEVVEINRGDKRKLLEIKILADSNTQFEDFGKIDLASISPIDLRIRLLEGGVWPCIRQRPYNVIANPTDVPKSIFISGFDSNPLGPDLDFVLDNEKEAIQVAVDTLAKLTPGKVNVSIHSSQKNSIFKGISNIELHTVNGPHPSGNVGIQIHHIDPINKGEKVWVVNATHLPMIGKLVANGHYDASTTIALAGSELKSPKYFDIKFGADLSAVLKDNVKEGNQRIISGNVLTGTKINHSPYLGFYDNVVSVIPEGDYSEFFGWLSFSPKKISLSRAFPAWLMPGKTFKVDTNNHGEDRAFVVTGQYEQYIPMDIYPMQLLKAIMAGDIELMENLGIYEVAPEDFSLAEFSCTSKQELQKIIQEGIETMIKEVG